MEIVKRLQLGKDNPEGNWKVVDSPGRSIQIRPTQWLWEPS